MPCFGFGLFVRRGGTLDRASCLSLWLCVVTCLVTLVERAGLRRTRTLLDFCRYVSRGIDLYSRRAGPLCLSQRNASQEWLRQATSGL